MKKTIILFCLLLVLTVMIGCTISRAALQLPGETKSTRETTKKTPAPRDVAPEDNLAFNPGFEDGTDGWFPFGSCTIDTTTEVFHSGASSAFVTDRTENWNGIAIDLTTILENGKTYIMYGWVLLNNIPAASVNMTVKKVDDTGTKFIQVCSRKASSDEWTQLYGEYTVEAFGKVKEQTLYFEGPKMGIDFFVDDIGVGLANQG
jgi:endo-1,4-beta-xylanase